ncbi:MAG: SDR family oxidoreductase [Pirellulaceae bacterium]|nr:SDR family oxidoreductase [Pirellulaceae bacterium]
MSARHWSSKDGDYNPLENVFGPQKILLTGATGYVGGRLLSQLRDRHCSVRCLMRRRPSEADPEFAALDVAVGNVLDLQSLNQALVGIETAYYLIHSMGDNDDFEETDRRAAENFARACSEQGVKRIIYLGGLGDESSKLSKHLRSRQEIGNILRTSTATVIEFRASIVIGSGSLSFEMIRALVERLPVMICPKWVRVLAQPIAIEDVLAYLVEALDHPPGSSEIYEIGGPDQVSYGEIMQRYARQRGLRRFMIPVPFLTPYLSSLWLGLVTPLYSRVGRKLVDSLKNPTLVQDTRALERFSVTPRSVEESIARALVNEDREFAETRWSDAFSAGGEQKSWGGVRFGSRLVDSRTREVPLPASQAFTAIRRIGGETGWYYGNWLWKVRGFLDLLVGGVGVRRGRRHPDQLRVGDTVDFWRVEEFQDNKLLRLAAEMKVPGRAWLEFEVTEEGGKSTVRQTAIFDPVGLFGIVYWYSLFPLHELVFRGMLRNLCRAALTNATAKN